MNIFNVSGFYLNIIKNQLAWLFAFIYMYIYEKNTFYTF